MRKSALDNHHVSRLTFQKAHTVDIEKVQIVMHSNQTVYIMGRGYSGSTILSSLLGHAPGIHCVGELIFPMKIACGCGDSFDDCVFWQQVRHEFEATTQLPWEASMQKLREQAHFKNFPRTFTARAHGEYLQELRTINAGITAAILTVAGDELLLDSSKQPTRALFLMRTQKKARFLHVVRSPYRYIYSYMQRLKRGKFDFMRRRLDPDSVGFFTFMLVAFGWLAVNMQCEIVRVLNPKRVMRIRYEDIIENPDATMNDIAAFLQYDMTDVSNAIQEREAIPVGHIIGGNAHMREAGVFIFEPQKGKSVELPKSYEVMVKLICWPLMLLYGYPFRRPRTEKSRKAIPA